MKTMYSLSAGLACFPTIGIGGAGSHGGGTGSICSGRPLPDEFYPKPPPTEPAPVLPSPPDAPQPQEPPAIPSPLPEQAPDPKRPVVHPTPPPEVPSR
ncbi:hypothetical protein ACFOYU_03115 [Microvirga sp. GCM10011540]|uniref:hypothetical protein n=1 Tax=Microvirga sp. GCM10011540 TaxID=3317338 RepID=UPI0036113B95